MTGDMVLYEKEAGVGMVTINRPNVRNALSRAVFLELKQVLSEVRKDEDVRVLIVTGAGDAFVAGADVGDLTTLEPIRGWFESRFHQSILDDLERTGRPSIAAINGAALGGGLELAMACTIRIASEKAKLGLPELSLGILPGFGGTQRLMRIVGYAKAAELLLTAAIISAEEAQKIGLVNQVVPQETLMDTAKNMAQSIGRLNPLTVKLASELLLQSRNTGLDEGLAMESALACLAFASQETKELLYKFLEKRK